MINKTALILGALAVTMTVSACSGFSSKPKLEDARFWQRSSASSALYMRGPKAQQMLHKNLSGCKNNIGELQNLGAIREAMPTNYNSGNTGEPRTAAEQELDKWDTPQRDGYRYAEHLDYHDFETCMIHKGWERVGVLPYTDSDRARAEYLDNMGYGDKNRLGGDRENVTSLNPSQQNPAPYENVNE